MSSNQNEITITNDSHHSKFYCHTESGPRVGLTVNIDGLKPTICDADRRLKLTWRNDTKTPDQPLLEAMGYWEKACGIKFTKDLQNPFFTFRDATPEEERELPGVIAYAFFPGDSPREVVLLATFNSQFNKVSVLAHELGHLLGFRHEHIWIGLTEETTEGAQKVTRYDKNSIMHYKKIFDDEDRGIITKLSTLDKTGARVIYGDPLGAGSSFYELNE